MSQKMKKMNLKISPESYINRLNELDIIRCSWCGVELMGKLDTFGGKDYPLCQKDWFDGREKDIKDLTNLLYESGYFENEADEIEKAIRNQNFAKIEEINKKLDRQIGDIRSEIENLEREIEELNEQEYACEKLIVICSSIVTIVKRTKK